MGGGPVVGLGLPLAPLLVSLARSAKNACAFGWGLALEFAFGLGLGCAFGLGLAAAANRLWEIFHPIMSQGHVDARGHLDPPLVLGMSQNDKEPAFDSRRRLVSQIFRPRYSKI